MKSTFKIALLGMIIIFGIAACTKDEPQVNTPKVIIKSPQNGEVFNAGDTVFIQAVLSGKVDLHGYEVTLENMNTAEKVFSYNAHVHHVEINVDTFWVNHVTTESDLTLSILAIGDHAGTTTTESVDMQCKP